MSYPPAPGPALIIRHTGQVLPLTRTTVTLGRQATNTVVLSDAQVSRHHAMISWQAGTYVIEDLGSANGTYVNERKITGPLPLRQGAVVRMGNTVMDLQLAPPADTAGQMSPAGAVARGQAPSDSQGRSALPIFVGLFIAGTVLLCGIVAAFLLLRGGKPVVTIQSPVPGVPVVVGEEIVLQVAATGVRNISRLDLSVDDTLVARTNSLMPDGQASLSVTQAWTFEQPGTHIVSSVAYSERGKVSDVASVEVTVAEQRAPETPTATPTSPTTTTPTVTPSTTPIPTLQPPTPEAPPVVIPTNTLPPPATATQTSVPTPTATEAPPPAIDFFQADPETIVAGGCTTLEWGVVTNANEASIDQGIGGVGSPGSVIVCPAETTTYTLTATGEGGITTESATVTVTAALPDLTIEAISFVPDPPVQNQDNQVRLTIRNVGTGSADPFSWEWRPGTAAPIVGSVPTGLNPGDAVIVTAVWNPANWYSDLTTVARVDPDDLIVESDETNNTKEVIVQVVKPSEMTVTLTSEALLDGYVIGGQGSYNALDIRVGNIAGIGGERIYRGFLSFNLVGIPASATILSTELRFYQQEIVGNPYSKLGNLLLKHVDFGSSLEASDFDGPELNSSILSSHTSPGQWYAITSDTLAHWIGDDLTAGRGRFQGRLQFSVETDDGLTTDYVHIESGDDFYGTGNLPQLTITYLP
ncbi:FHA domain-containing protein [Chloroflexota bacterium]